MKMSQGDGGKASKEGDGAQEASRGDGGGEEINPYMPMYLAKAPWYMSTGQASLDHQRRSAVKRDSDLYHERGLIERAGERVKKFKPGSCDNCGATTHKVKECLERPRRRGAKLTGLDIRPDEYVHEASLDFEAKRDRWAGYDAADYAEVIGDWRAVEEEQLKAREEGLSSTARGGDAGGSGDEESGSSSGDEEDAEQEDMPGQKVDLKTRMTVRNLRLREDRANYLHSLDADSATYNPKSRSYKPIVPVEEGDNAFVLSSEGGAQQAAPSGERQLFAWQQPSDPAIVPLPPRPRREVDRWNYKGPSASTAAGALASDARSEEPAPGRPKAFVPGRDTRRSAQEALFALYGDSSANGSVGVADPSDGAPSAVACKRGRRPAVQRAIEEESALCHFDGTVGDDKAADRPTV